MKNIGTRILTIYYTGLCFLIRNSRWYSAYIRYFVYFSRLSIAESTTNLGKRGSFLSAKKYIIFYRSAKGLSKTKDTIFSLLPINFAVNRIAVTAPMLLPQIIHLRYPSYLA